MNLLDSESDSDSNLSFICQGGWVKMRVSVCVQEYDMERQSSDGDGGNGGRSGGSTALCSLLLCRSLYVY